MSLPHPLAVSFLLIFLVSLALDFFLVILVFANVPYGLVRFGFGFTMRSIGCTYKSMKLQSSSVFPHQTYY